MPARIVVQPNGLYARFSTVVDNFTDVNMTREEAWELMRDIRKVEAAEGHPERFAEALETIRRVHGQQAADLAKSETCRAIESVKRAE